MFSGCALGGGAFLALGWFLEPLEGEVPFEP